jgi:hypothetical protein
MNSILKVFKDIQRCSYAFPIHVGGFTLKGTPMGTAALAIEQRTGLREETIIRAIKLLTELRLIRRLRYGTYVTTWRGKDRKWLRA